LRVVVSRVGASGCGSSKQERPASQGPPQVLGCSLKGENLRVHRPSKQERPAPEVLHKFEGCRLSRVVAPRCRPLKSKRGSQGPPQI